MSETKSVMVDATYVAQKIEQLMQTPQVQEIIYLQSVLKSANEVDVVEEKDDKPIKTKK